MKNYFCALIIFLFAASVFAQPNSIDVIEKIRLGGLDQTVLIRGDDAGKPVLLLLHGGPGFSEFVFFRTFNRDLEREFVVVNWEQRGTGLSYSETVAPESMNIAQIAQDARQLVQILKKRFKQDKIFLLGHSWGSVIGLKLASLHPTDFYAYVGVGQVVSGIENEKQSLAFALRMARLKKNAEAVAELEKVARSYPPGDENMLEHLTVQRRWLEHFGGVFYGNMNYRKLFGKIGKDELALYDSAAASKGEMFSMKRLWMEVLRVDFTKSVSKLEIPVYFFLGRSDYNTPSEIARDYFRTLKAPRKEIVWFERSGHFVPFEEPEKFNRVMVKKVLKNSRPLPNRFVK